MNTVHSLPRLRKAKRIVGKRLVFRDARLDDAMFILKLRTDANKAKHLSFTPDDIALQERWLETYTISNDQAYFIIQDLAGEPLGTIRLYDPQENSFCWGSWILKEGSPSYAAIESALIVYSYAIGHLGFEQAHFDIRKENTHVWQFHERFGAELINETDQDRLYVLRKSNILESQKRYRKFLPQDVLIEN